jgi:hypothetical protein
MTTQALAIRVGDKREVVLSCTLSFSIFPGPPGYQDVRQGDTLELTLDLDEAQCFVGDEELELKARFRARIYSWRSIRSCGSRSGC